MKTAKQLLQAYIDGNAKEAAALFAENGALAALSRGPRCRASLRRAQEHWSVPHLSPRKDVSRIQVRRRQDLHRHAGSGIRRIHHSSEIRHLWAPRPSAILRPLHGSRRENFVAKGSAQRARRCRRNVSERNRRCHQQNEVGLRRGVSQGGRP
jgi:hypothetical protein